MRCGHADIGVARRGRIDESGAKARANGGHKIARVGAAKTTVHALPLLQRVIGHGDAAHQRLAATRRKGTKIDHNGGQWCDCRSFEIDRAQGQSSGDAAKRISDKQAADVILSEQHVDNFYDQFFGIRLG